MEGSLGKLTVFLCCVWAASLLYGEMVAFWLPSLWNCAWPQLSGSSSRTMMIDEVASQGGHLKVAVIADPQLMDRTSHGLAPKSLALEMSQFYTDLYMRRAFLESVMPLKPHLIVFLGDYFDGGPVLLDEEWEESLSRFKHIFNLNHRGTSIDIPVYYIPGNHDIGYTALHSYNPKIISRYEKEFGIRNHNFTVGQVKFIVVDAQTLDGKCTKFQLFGFYFKCSNSCIFLGRLTSFIITYESTGLKHGSLTSASWNFVKNISTDDIFSPKVLLTHIPLYRLDETPCGLHRSSPIINQRVSSASNDQGITYQNYLTEETSTLLLDLIKPVLVLSGHDHDQCTVTHSTQNGLVIEHTVGTFSWQQGNLYPSFMLLSVSNVATSNTTNLDDIVSSQLCFLPMQTHIYIWYISLFVLTVLVLMIWPKKGWGCMHQQNHFLWCIARAIGSTIQKDGSKEKDKDDLAEYEMIWDAEGTMHVVKKVIKNADIARSSESELIGRGSAQVRPTAKKHSSQKTVESSSIEMNADLHLEEARRAPKRSKKPGMKTLTKRLVRTLKSLMVIAAVNVPLYMMLLFKDWIDL